MSKKNLTCFLFWSVVFFQIFVNSSSAQINNPRYFNERFVISDIQKIDAAQMTYARTVGANNFAILLFLDQLGLIDKLPILGSRRGYHFEMRGYDFEMNKIDSSTSGGGPQYYLTATPHIYGKTGIRSFYIDQTGDLRGADKKGKAATITDPRIDACSFNSGKECVLLDMRKILGAQITFFGGASSFNYGNFEQLSAANLINPNLATRISNGYRYTITTSFSNTNGTIRAGFEAFAVPQEYGVTGIKSYYIDRTGFLRGADKNGLPADKNDPLITN